MNIFIDTREKAKAIENIKKYFDENGIKYTSQGLFVGDYTLVTNQSICVDRKQNLSEVVSNVCQDHIRFTNELKRAKENGIKLIILIEHGRNIKCLEDVKKWINPRIKVSPRAMNGETLYKVLNTMIDRYGIEIDFCCKQDTGKRIIELLQNKKCD